MVVRVNDRQRRAVTQKDVDDLSVVQTKMGLLRISLLNTMVEFFPTIAEDIFLGSELRNPLNKDFYRAHGRLPTDDEMFAELEKKYAPQ